jgi:hypothetical protein
MLDGLDATFEATLKSTFAAEISNAIDAAFKDLGTDLLTKKTRTLLADIVAFSLCRDCSDFADDLSINTGLVFAGYGNDELFPTLMATSIRFFILGTLIKDATDTDAITISHPARMQAFAQQEMVHDFMSGAVPEYRTFLMSYLKDVYTALPAELIEELALAPKEKAKITKKFKEICEQKFAEFEELETAIVDTNTKPILETLVALPETDMAIMAETMINLQSFKRRMSMDDQETVAPPIDVASITKGAGFVWIKRK